ncbi:MAG TPA: DUF4115 domain-containing protein [Acidimicrobiales bacterium]|jgi:hypothetical protein
MSTPVLAAIIVVALGVVFLAARRRLADGRSVEAHHRVLETMGRLAAQHPSGPSPEVLEGPASQAHVRLVNDAESADGAVAPEPAAYLPSTSREAVESRQLDSWSDVTPAGVTPAGVTRAWPIEAVGPAPAPVVAPASTPAPAPPPPIPGPATAVARIEAPPVLHFDDTPNELPVLAARVRRLGWRTKRPVLGLPLVGALIAILLVAGTLGGMALRSPHRSHSPVGHPSAAAVAPPAVHPAIVPASTAPVLVTTSAGYSEYRLTGPATVQLATDTICWIEIRQGGPTGPVLYEGDLSAGQTHVAPPSTWVRLGNPGHVTVTVNGVPISLPSLIAGQPYNVMFE